MIFIIKVNFENFYQFKLFGYDFPILINKHKLARRDKTFENF